MADGNGTQATEAVETVPGLKVERRCWEGGSHEPPELTLYLSDRSAVVVEWLPSAFPQTFRLSLVNEDDGTLTACTVDQTGLEPVELTAEIHKARSAVRDWMEEGRDDRADEDAAEAWR